MWAKNMKMQEERNLLPHLFPVWQLAILQRLGIVMATAGFIPASFAMGERKTAQIQAGMASNLLIWVQQAGGTLVLAFLAAPRQGMRLTATLLRGLFPQSSAP